MRKQVDSLIVSIFVLLICALFIARLNIIKGASFQGIEKPVLPVVVDGWNFGREISLSDDVLSILGTKGAILSEYVNHAGDKIYLYVLRTAGRRSSIHQPEYCYLGGGKNELLKQGTVYIADYEGKNFPVNFLCIQTAGGFQAVLYFYTANDLITNSYYKQQFYFLVNRIKGKKIEGELVRVSKFYVTGDLDKELQILQAFISSIVRKL